MHERALDASAGAVDAEAPAIEIGPAVDVHAQGHTERRQKAQRTAPRVHTPITRKAPTEISIHGITIAN